jgi:hypothetical protein
MKSIPENVVMETWFSRRFFRLRIFIVFWAAFLVWGLSRLKVEPKKSRKFKKRSKKSKGAHRHTPLDQRVTFKNPIEKFSKVQIPKIIR